MKSLKVEKGVPIPSVSPMAASGERYVYPWDEMEVGDSFFVPDRLSYQVSPTCSNVGMRRGWKLVTRTVTQRGVIGCRVWRVE